jgi:hypothetical protein
LASCLRRVCQPFGIQALDVPDQDTWSKANEHATSF